MIVETSRLVIRRLAAADVPSLPAIWCGPEVTRFLGGPRNFQKVSDSLREDLAAVVPPTFDVRPAIEKATGRVVGDCGVLDKTVEGQPEFELVYVLAVEVWGRGCATEAAAAMSQHAVRVLGLKRLISLIDLDHLASRRVAEKIGMTQGREVARPGGKKLLYVIDLE
ncbi:MAG: GNAT family N-acetyltransferase [Dongiaceae bacterium]